MLSSLNLLFRCADSYDYPKYMLSYGELISIYLNGFHVYVNNFSPICELPANLDDKYCLEEFV